MDVLCRAAKNNKSLLKYWFIYISTSGGSIFRPLKNKNTIRELSTLVVNSCKRNIALIIYLFAN